MTAFSPPRRLSENDDLSAFESGASLIDAWVHAHAKKASEQGTAVVYVCAADGKVAGLYSLSAHSVLRESVKGGWLRRNSPEQIPAILLGMLGVDTAHQGHGLGTSLLRDAILRSQRVSSEIGAQALLVDPVDETAADFYLHFGFRKLPGTKRMFLPPR